MDHDTISFASCKFEPFGHHIGISVLYILFVMTQLPEPSANAVLDTEDTTLSTDLKPPPLPDNDRKSQFVLFVINIYGVKNSSGETSDEIFENTIIDKTSNLTGE